MNVYELTNEIISWNDFFNSIKEILTSIKINPDNICPNIDNIFRIFKEIPPLNIKICIFGQDPYPDYMMANGIAFSTPKGIKKIPPSLRNILKAIENQGFTVDRICNGDLSCLVSQGVFLCNAALTCEKGKSLSHISMWSKFTKELIMYLNRVNPNIIYILWGKVIYNNIIHLLNNTELVIKNTHPSPLAGKKFILQNDFLKANELLLSINKTPINWSIQ
jgi:uracil-DNA glycosylase